MPRKKPTDYVLYRWRYPIAYTLVAAVVIFMLSAVGLLATGGLSQLEIDTALVSSSLRPLEVFNYSNQDILFLPYHLLQAVSIHFLGFTPFSIKLPSILLAVFSAIGTLLLLHKWHRPNVAIIAATIAVTTGPFLYAAQSGSSSIMYIFCTVALLLAASHMAMRTTVGNLWIVLGFILAGISLYLPLFIYVLVALVVTAFLHPHARHVILRTSDKRILALGIFLMGAISLPLLFAVFKSPTLLYDLLGLTQSPSQLLGTMRAQFMVYARSLFAPSSTSLPIYSFGVMALIALGYVRMVSTKYTTKSYLMSSWLILTVPLLLVNPLYSGLLYMPVLYLIGLSIEYLIWSWYRLFPRNPYARVFGLLPLGVLVCGIAISNLGEYMYSHRYNTNAYSSYSFDLNTFDRYIATYEQTSSLALRVAPGSKALYEAYAAHQSHVASISVATESTLNASNAILIMDREQARQSSNVPSEIIVNTAAHKADRFYIYKPTRN